MMVSFAALPASLAQAAGQNGPGPDIGKAGQLTGSATGSLASSTSDDWWVVYPAAPGGSVTVSVKNTAPATSCDTLTATLDSSNGSGSAVAGITLDRGLSHDLTGARVGSDRYFVEVRAASCQPPQGQPLTYSLTLNSGGGGTPPAPATGEVKAGTSLGTARPPLQGTTSYTGTVTSASSDDWYVLFKKNDDTPATIRVEDTTVAGMTTCATLSVSLDAANGSEEVVGGVTLSDNSAQTFTVPGLSATDPTGLYYLEVKSPECPSGGISYRIEPEKGTEWRNPARLPAGTAPPASSIGAAWPPLKGATTYDGTFASGADHHWYVLFRKSATTPVTVRVENTTIAGSTSCSVIAVSLDGADGSDHTVAGATLSDNAAATLQIPVSGTPDYLGEYFLEVSVADCPAGGATYRIEPEPDTGWASPAKPANERLPSGSDQEKAGGPLMGGVDYQGALASATSQDWVFLIATGKTPLTVSVKNTTPSPDNCQDESITLFDSGGTVAGATLGDDDGAELVADSDLTYYLEISVAGDCPPEVPMTVNVRMTPPQAACSCGCAAPSAQNPATQSPAATAPVTIEMEKPGGGTMPVSGTTTTVGVGEPIDLSLNCGPKATLTGPYKWALPAGSGYPATLSNYEINENGSTASTTLTRLTKFTSPKFSFYALKPGTYQVTATATVSGTATPVSATFDAKAPQTEFSASTCEADLNTKWTFLLPVGTRAPDRLSLGLNDNCVKTPGLTWSAKATLKDRVFPDSDLAVVQLVSGTIQHNKLKACLTTMGKQQADGSAFYPTGTATAQVSGHTVSGFTIGPDMETVKAGGTRTIGSYDAPSASLHNGGSWTTDLTFTDYLVYRPNFKPTASGHIGIWVALRHLSWTFKASASFSATTLKWNLGKVKDPNPKAIKSTVSPTEPEFASVITPAPSCP